MNRLPALFLAALFAGGALTASAIAQPAEEPAAPPAPPAPTAPAEPAPPPVPAAPQALPAELKTAPALDGNAERRVNEWVQAYFQRMVPPGSRREAREALANEPAGAGPAFQRAYANAVGARAAELLGQNGPDMHVRLNAAIVVARVAETTRSNRLETATLALLAENQPEVLKIWGLRAARFIVPELIDARQSQGLLERIPAVVQQHPGGAVTEEAYEALKVVNPVAIDALMNVTEIRLQIYRGAVPEDPHLDAEPARFVSGGGARPWQAMTPPQRQRAMQQMINLLTFAAHQAERAGVDRGTRDGLITGVIQPVARSIQAIAMVEQAGTLADAVRPLGDLRPGAAVDLTELVRPVPAAAGQLRGLQQFQEPSLEPAATATGG